MATQCNRSMLLGKLIVGAALSWLMTGCDESGDALNVFPGNATVGPNISTFTIVVVSATREIMLPLEWSVSNPGLGNIASTSGYSAVYARSVSNGVNSVTVCDQYGTKGVVAVDQVEWNTGQPGTSTNTALNTTTNQ